MAKIAFTKLGLSKNNEIKILEWNGQKIEVKQFLSTKDKLDLIAKVIGLSTDDHVFYNPCKVQIFLAAEIILAYTNITITEKQQEDILKLYDLLISSNFLKQIEELIPEEELGYIQMAINDTIKEIYRYRDSAMGVMQQIAEDYKDTQFDIKNLVKDIDELQENSITVKSN